VAGLVPCSWPRWRGRTWTATCGARNFEYVKSLGADEVLDYKTPEGHGLKSPKGVKYDVLLDATPSLGWETVGPVLAPRGMPRAARSLSFPSQVIVPDTV